MQLQCFIWWFPIAAHRNIILIKRYPALHENGWRRLEAARTKQQNDCDYASAAPLSSPHTLNQEVLGREQCQARGCLTSQGETNTRSSTIQASTAMLITEIISMVGRSRWRAHYRQSLSPYHSIPEGLGKLRMAFLARMEAVRCKVGDIWIPVLQIKA